MNMMNKPSRASGIIKKMLFILMIFGACKSGRAAASISFRFCGIADTLT